MEEHRSWWGRHKSIYRSARFQKSEKNPGLRSLLIFYDLKRPLTRTTCKNLQETYEMSFKASCQDLTRLTKSGELRLRLGTVHQPLEACVNFSAQCNLCRHLLTQNHAMLNKDIHGPSCVPYCEVSLFCANLVTIPVYIFKIDFHWFVCRCSKQ